MKQNENRFLLINSDWMHDISSLGDKISLISLILIWIDEHTDMFTYIGIQKYGYFSIDGNDT